MQLDETLSKVLEICSDNCHGKEVFLLAHEFCMRLTAQGSSPYQEFERWHPFAFTYLCLNDLVNQISEGIMIHHEFKGLNSNPIFTGTIKKLGSLGIGELSQFYACDELNTVLRTYSEATSRMSFLNSSYIKHVDAYMNEPIFNEIDMLNWSSFKYAFSNLP